MPRNEEGEIHDRDLLGKCVARNSTVDQKFAFVEKKRVYKVDNVEEEKNVPENSARKP